MLESTKMFKKFFFTYLLRFIDFNLEQGEITF